jgi:general secretion pathway protein I
MSGRRGFTLVEVVAALFLLALGFGLLMQLLGGALSQTRRAALQTEMALIAQSLIDRLGMDLPLEAGERSGETESGLRYRLFIAEEPAGSSAPGATHPFVLFRVRLEISAEAGGEASFETLRVAARRP